MSNAEVSRQDANDWGVSNPWPWMGLGLVGCLGAFVCAQLSDGGLPLRFSLLVAGVLAAAVALWLRSRRPGRAAIQCFSPGNRALLALGTAVLCALLAVGASLLLLQGWSRSSGLPWTRGELILLWFLVAPWSALLAVRFWPAVSGRADVSPNAEGAALCLQGALAAFLACWALYEGAARVVEWDSLRLFFAGLALVALVASYVAGAGPRLRRGLVSALIVFHLGGIVTVCLAHEPSPWTFQQIWVRLYRPYLEFMYLNNAYRFYAPEPGPAYQLWCYLEYPSDKGKPVESRWVKIPDLDNDGRPQYLLALQYQRRLALTENVARPTAQPPLFVIEADGRMKMAEFARKRDDQSPFPQSRDVLGHEKPPDPLGIPYHPDKTVQQYQPPDVGSWIVFPSFARRLCSMPHPDRPGMHASSVKIYRVQHRMLRPEEFARGEDPHDALLYLPYYMGKFDPDGTLLDQNDPFLFWLLPMIPDNVDPQRKVRNCAAQHAMGSRKLELVNRK